MPGHGDHWEAICSLEEYTSEKLGRDVREGELISSYDCVDVVGGTDRTEQLFCLRWGSGTLVHQVLVVSHSPDKSNHMFSAYPVVLDGHKIDVKISRVESWGYGIEGWIEGEVTNEGIPLAFFDTMYFAGSASLQEGDTVAYRLAGFAYSLQPIERHSFEIDEGPFWEKIRQERLDEGATEEEASRPLTFLMAGSAIFLPGDGDRRDEAQFQGMIEAIEILEHDGQKIYRLEMVLMRPGDEEFRLPVYASEHVLRGYVPRLGEDVEGVLWLQGYRAELDRA